MSNSAVCLIPTPTDIEGLPSLWQELVRLHGSSNFAFGLQSNIPHFSLAYFGAGATSRFTQTDALTSARLSMHLNGVKRLELKVQALSYWPGGWCSLELEHNLIVAKVRANLVATAEEHLAKHELRDDPEFLLNERRFLRRFTPHITIACAWPRDTTEKSIAPALDRIDIPHRLIEFGEIAFVTLGEHGAISSVRTRVCLRAQS